MSTRDEQLSEFVAEGEEALDGMGRGLIDLEAANKRGARIDPDILNGVYRHAHTLKGLAGMFGYEALGSLAHHLEDLLHQLRIGKLPASAGIMDVLFDGVEVSRTLLHDKDNTAVAQEANLIVERVADVLSGAIPSRASGESTRGGRPEAAPAAPDADNEYADIPLGPEVWNVLSEYEEFRLKENIRAGVSLYKVHACFALETFDTDLIALTDLLKAHGEVITTLPSPEESDGESIRFILLLGVDGELSELENLPDVTLECIREGTAPEQSAVEQDTAGTPETKTKEDSTAQSARAMGQTVRVDIRKLDTLMNTVGELVLAKTVIQQIGEKLRTDTGFTGIAVELFKATRMLERKLVEFQDGVMEVRMVPIGQIYDRLHRTVRNVSREVEKDIEFITSGADTELDKLIMEQLADPLMHIIRNAIDHGIETPHARVNAGKPAVGNIKLTAYQQGNHVVIEISDDGRGLDFDRILQRGIERGLVAPNAVLTREEIADLIFQPGFSTKDEVSELSGRGVGMDVVRRNIGDLSGILDVASELGEGTTIKITLPITLAIIQALIVEVGQETYAMPLTAVLESLMIKADDIQTIEQREVITLRDRTLPLMRLADVFDLDAGDLIGQEAHYVVVVGMAEKRLGLVVDRLLGRQDVVIKPLGEALGVIPGIAGATELGNQETVLVLDVAELILEATSGSIHSRGGGTVRPRDEHSVAPTV